MVLPTRTDTPEHEGEILELLARELGSDAPSWQQRERGWLGLLPTHVIWVAADAPGWRALTREAALLDLVRVELDAVVPRIELSVPALRMQVRERKSGVLGEAIEARIFGTALDARPDAAARLQPSCPLTPWGLRFAEELGRAFACVHRALPLARAGELGLEPARFDWDAVARALSEHVDDPRLLRAQARARAWDEGRRAGPSSVGLHGDPHLFNVFASDAGQLSGLIDFGDAVLGDRHEDLRYVHSQGLAFAQRAVAAYTREAGIMLELDTVARLHVCGALEHFAWVLPTAPRFGAILEWSRAAIDRLAPEWGA